MLHPQKSLVCMNRETYFLTMLSVGCLSMDSCKQECIPVGCVPSAAVAVSGGGGVSARHPPWTEFLTHACENITFLQLHLRMVKKQESIPISSGMRTTRWPTVRVLMRTTGWPTVRVLVMLLGVSAGGGWVPCFTHLRDTHSPSEGTWDQAYPPHHPVDRYTPLKTLPSPYFIDGR